jgi:uncharacterized protein YcbK (DUF882 family)
MVLWIRHAHTGEEVHLRVSTSGLEPLAWARANRFFREPRTAATRVMVPRLLRLLTAVQDHFGGRRIEVFSAYRPELDPETPDSRHRVGAAADIRIRGVSPRAIFEYCRTLPDAGCGLYPNEMFVHVDTRPRAAFWVDLTVGKGHHYVRDASGWLAGHPDAGQ